MALGEFDLIARWFHRPPRQAPSGLASRVAFGNGDDCALLQTAPGMQLAVSTDLLVEGRHFFANVAPDRLGHKALAVNLSDLAACGARPLAYTLALSLPRVDHAWLDGFAHGLHALADAHDLSLVGGDTTAGPLTIGITIFGEVPAGQALMRHGARAGDELWVSHARHGGLGDARLALEALRGQVALADSDLARVRRALERPQPRIALGIALRGVASSALDLSDGLLGDLGHVLRRSAEHTGAPLGATVHAAQLPCGAAQAQLDAAQRLRHQLAGGDDYELLFTAPAAAHEAVQAAAQTGHTAVRRIGTIDAEPGVRVHDAAGRPIKASWQGFDHFATTP